MDYRFGDFELDSDRRELSCNGEAVRIADQPLDVLIYFLENRDRMVTRDELIEHFWRTAPHGADDRLNSCVCRIRNALGDTRGATQFIETRARVGYRFIGIVEQDKTASWRHIVGRASTLKHLASNHRAIFFGSLLALSITVSVPFVQGALTANAASLALPPLQAYCKKSAYTFFNEGLRDILLADFKNALPPGVVLIKSDTMDSAASGNGHYLDISVRHIDTEALVTVAFISGDDGRVLWTKQYREAMDLKDFTATQQPLSKQIVSEIAAQANLF